MVRIATVNSLVVFAALGLTKADPSTNDFIHDLVCKELEKTDDKEQVVAAVCKTVHVAWPEVPEFACERGVKNQWDTIVKDCESKNLPGIPDVIKKEIHDFVCKELEKTDDEKEVAAAVCTKLHASFPAIPEELCTLGVTHEWDSLKNECKAKSLTGIPDVIKKELHDLVCKELEKTDDEKEVAAAVCTKLHASFPAIPEELCTLGVTHEWDSLKSECKAKSLQGIPDVIKKELHDLVCKELEKTDDEKEVAAAVCTKLHASFPAIPEELCTLGVTHEWDSLKSECKAKSLKGIPDVIKKELHDLVCKELEKTDDEKEVAAAVCTKLHASFPAIPEELCTLGVMHEWDSLKSECKAKSLKGIPDFIKKELHDLVCKELEKTDDEQKVASAACTKVHTMFPIIAEAACEIEVKDEWSSLAQSCGSERLQGIPDVIKQKIHDLVCKVLEKTDVEEDVAFSACTIVHSTFPGIVEAACETEVKASWTQIVKACTMQPVVV